LEAKTYLADNFFKTNFGEKNQKHQILEANLRKIILFYFGKEKRKGKREEETKILLAHLGAVLCRPSLVLCCPSLARRQPQLLQAVPLWQNHQN
jgi:hypothetical protein